MKTSTVTFPLWLLFCSVVNAQATGNAPGTPPASSTPPTRPVEAPPGAEGAHSTPPPPARPAEGTADRPAAEEGPDGPSTAAEEPAGAAASGDAAGLTPNASAYSEEQFAMPGAEGGDAEETYELSAAELAELGFATEEGAATAVDTSVKIYGFMDAGFQASLNDFSKQVNGRKATLYVGNLNVYLSKAISETVRTMMEVRFLLLPNGAPDGMGGLTVTEAPDYQDFNRPLRWGGVEIERVYLEWAMHELLSVRAGIFLTPYGIWNVDHGTPTIIPPRRPFAIGNGYFPERQTGLEFFGSHALSANETMGYHLTVSNGLGPTPDYRDLDGNKALGGRVFLETRTFGNLKVGGSVFYGSYTDANAGVMIAGEEIVTQYDDLALAADVLFNLEAFVLQAEVTHRQRAHGDRGRTAVAAQGPPAIPADTYGWAYYCLVGYRLPWLEIMPYFMTQTTTGYGTSYLNATSLQPGLNIRALPELVIKIEYTHVFGDRSLRNLVNQIAWAF